MRISARTATPILAFCYGLLAHCVDTKANSPELLARSFEHQNIFGAHRIRFVFPSSIVSQGNLLEEKSKQALQRAESTLGLFIRDSFDIYFALEPDFHNGLTTVIPSNRVVVHLEPPTSWESIGISVDYLEETLVHEFAHMITTQQRGGVFSWLSYLVGNTSRPVGAWPRWIHEGLAVWTESHACSKTTLSGRAGSGYIDWELRQYAEYYARQKKHPLDNSDLDASSKFSQARVGTGSLSCCVSLANVSIERSVGRAAARCRVHEKNPGLSWRLRLRLFNLAEGVEARLAHDVVPPLPRVDHRPKGVDTH